MKSLTFVTGNTNKAEQLDWYLRIPVEHSKLDVPEIQSLDLEEVATEKAKAAYQILQTPVLVEDTSLGFEALNGLPGTLVKWFLESIGNEGLTQLLHGYENRTAVAEVCFALCDEDGVRLFKEETKGVIADTLQAGVSDFGWNSIFIPEGSNLTWAQMEPDQQKETSMRKRAIDKLQEYLETNYK